MRRERGTTLSGTVGILLRGMRWRLSGSVLTALTAAIAVGAAIVGPLYLQAGGDSLVRHAVATASEYQAGVTFTAEPSHPTSLAGLQKAQARLYRRYGLDRWYEKPIVTVDSGVRMTNPSGAPFEDQLLSRTGICSTLHLISGTCTLTRENALVSSRSAAKLDVRVGSTVTMQTIVVPQSTVRVHIVGIYEPPDTELPTWFGEGLSFFPFGFTSGAPLHLPELDGLIVSAATALAVPSNDQPTLQVQTQLRPGAVGLHDSGQIVTALAAATHTAEGQGFTVTTALSSLIQAARQQRHLMTTIVAVAAVQLALLAIWVLTSLLLRSADLRRSELRVARLRGFPLISILSVTVAEPAILCGVGVILGVLAAWVAVSIASRVLFFHGTTVAVDLWVFVGFAAAVLTICGVLALSALRLMRRSGLDEANAAAASSGRQRLVVDAVILVLSVVGLVAASTSGALASHSNPIAAAAPALVALGTSVIAIRVIALICRRVISATRDSDRVATFLAARQVGRRPVQLRESRSLIIALCLACFAISAWSVARTNRATAADFGVGAASVVSVSADANLQQAVDRADPDGRWAMAAVDVTTSSSRVLAVDPSRMGAILSWPRGVSRATLAEVSRSLSPATAPQVNVGSHSIAMTVSAQGSGASARHLSELDLSAWVFNPTAGTSIISLGVLHGGTRSYRASLALACAGGCRLVGVGVVPSGDRAPGSGTVDLGVTHVSVGSASGAPQGIAADLSAGDWRSSASGVSVHELTGGVGFAIPAAQLQGYEGAAGGVTPPMASVADTPLNIPGAAGATALYGASISGSISSIAAAGIDGDQISVDPVISATALPRVGADAELVSLTLLTRTQTDPAIPGASDQVWLGADAPADAIARLTAAGLTVNGVQRASAVVSAEKDTGTALAYEFMLLATVVALLTVVVSTFGVLAAGTRQRATELSALEVAGVKRRVLVRSLGIEALVLAVTALFGAGAGVVGAAMAIPSLPQLSTAATAPLSYALPVVLILAVTLCVVLLVMLTTAISARGILLRMSPSLLRAAAYDVD